MSVLLHSAAACNTFFNSAEISKWGKKIIKITGWKCLSAMCLICPMSWCVCLTCWLRWRWFEGIRIAAVCRCEIPGILGKKKKICAELLIGHMTFAVLPQHCVLETISSFKWNPSVIKRVPVALESQGHPAHLEWCQKYVFRPLVLILLPTLTVSKNRWCNVAVKVNKDKKKTSELGFKL